MRRRSRHGARTESRRALLQCAERSARPRSSFFRWRRLLLLLVEQLGRFIGALEPNLAVSAVAERFSGRGTAATQCERRLAGFERRDWNGLIVVIEQDEVARGDVDGEWSVLADFDD